MNTLPLMNHPLDEPTAFYLEDLVAAVRQQRGAGKGSVPTLGILDFDGDLTDKLIARGEVQRCEHWPCFHTGIVVADEAVRDEGTSLHGTVGLYPMADPPSIAYSAVHSQRDDVIK